MSLRKRLGMLITKHFYRRPVLHDVPHSWFMHALAYGTWRKFRNRQRLRRAYRRHLVTVDAYPFEIRVDPTSVCNLRCPLCPTGAHEVDRGNGFMSVDTFRKILDRFGDYLYVIHLWVWGEPMLNKNLAQFVSLAEQRGIGTEVSTHLSVKLNDAEIDQLIGSGLTWLIVSCDAACAETYRQYRVGGDFALVISNLRRIVERKRALRSPTPFIEWQFVPLRHNEHEMKTLPALARSVGVDGLRFKPARLDKTRELTFRGTIPPDLLKWAPSRPELSHRIEDGGEAFDDNHCPFLWRSLTIHFDGAISPCCETYKVKDDFAHLDDDFLQFWNGPTYREARRVALGIDLTADDARFPCYGCRVFRKPHRSRAAGEREAATCVPS